MAATSTGQIGPVIVSSNAASRAHEIFSKQGWDKRQIHEILRRLYLGQPLKPEERKPIEEFLKALLEKEVGPADLSEEVRQRAIAKIIASLEAPADKCVLAETSKQERRIFLVLNTALATIYEGLGNGLYERAIEASAVGKGAIAKAGESAGSAARAAGGISSMTLEAGKGIGASFGAGVQSGAHSLISTASRLIGAIYLSTGKATANAQEKLGMTDVVVELKSRNQEVTAIQKALNSGRKQRAEQAVRKALVKLNAMHETELIASPVYDFLVQEAGENGKADLLISSLAACRRERLLYDISTRVTKAILSFGSETARTLAWDALSPQDARLAA